MWAFGQYRLEHRLVDAVTAVLALMASGSLVWYGSLFRRKTKNL